MKRSRCRILKAWQALNLSRTYVICQSVKNLIKNHHPGEGKHKIMSGNDQNVPRNSDNAPATQAVALFLQKQGIALYLVGAGVLLLALVIAFYFIKISRANEQASRLLGIAQDSKQFEELFRQYPKSSSAPVALLALAGSCFSSGDYESALRFYGEFIQKYPSHQMLPAAELGKVMCSETKGEMQNALLEFDSFLLAHPDSYLTPQALFGKARCLQVTGKSAEARIVYEDFVAAHPESKWRQQAEAAIQALDRQTRLLSAPGKKSN